MKALIITGILTSWFATGAFAGNPGAQIDPNLPKSSQQGGLPTNMPMDQGLSDPYAFGGQGTFEFYGATPVNPGPVSQKGDIGMQQKAQQVTQQGAPLQKGAPIQQTGQSFGGQQGQLPGLGSQLGGAGMNPGDFMTSEDRRPVFWRCVSRPVSAGRGFLYDGRGRDRRIAHFRAEERCERRHRRCFTRCEVDFRPGRPF